MTSRWVFAGLFSFALSACSSPPPSATADAPATSPPPAATPGPRPAPTTDEGLLASARAAAPEAVSRDATIIAMDDKMQMRTLHNGSNGWTCMPDNPQSPGADPMCLDQNGLEWAMAWMGRKDPPQGKVGFGYMLMGGSDASNDDPFATTPTAGQTWVETGPHVMILNATQMMPGYPTTHDNTKVPYVMFPGTKYAHLMIPVQ